MRLSLKKAAHGALVSASSRKSGSPRLFCPTYAGANVGHPFRFVGVKRVDYQLERSAVCFPVLKQTGRLVLIGMNSIANQTELVFEIA
jgi:hypothetical protein